MEMFDMQEGFKLLKISKTKMCSYCGKEIKNEKQITIMIDEVEYDFHEDCDFIPASHLIGAEGNFIGIDLATESK